MGKGKKDKAGKPAMDVKTKPDAVKKKKLERKPTDEFLAKYRFIFPQFVKGAAEANGIASLTDELAQSLAEDATYRLRSVVEVCAKYLKHSRHTRLTCADVNIALEMFDVPPIYGHGSEDAPSDFLALPGIFVQDDPEIELASLALSEISVTKHPVLVVRGKWMSNEEQKNKTDDSKTGMVDCVRVQNADSDTNSKDIESGDYEPKIATILIKYYAIICNSVLGYTDLTIIFKDLARNDKILPVVPSMLNFITITLNNFGTERQVLRLLQTIDALANNSKLDFRPFYPTLRIASVLLKIIKFAFVERKRDALLSFSDRSGATFQFSHSLTVRIKAAQILAKISRRWCCSEEQIIQEMVKLLTDLTLPARVHVGAITVLKELGPGALKIALWNNLDPLLQHLENVTSDRQTLEFAIIDASLILYKIPPTESPDCPSASKLDRYLFNYFGDRLCPFWVNQPTIAPLVRRENRVLQKSPILIKGSWQLPKCINSMYNPMAKRQSIQLAFELPKAKKKRNPRIIFKFAGANPVPEISLKRRRLDSRYSQFIAGKVSEGHVVLIGKYWRKTAKEPNCSAFYCSSLLDCL